MIGDRIKQARAAAGLSQRALAAQAGVSAMAVSKYETGRATPSSAVLLRLAKALGVRVEYFLRTAAPVMALHGYRKHKSTPKKLLRQIEAEVRDQLERFLELERLFPALPLQPFEVPAQVPAQVCRGEQLEEAAEAVRDAWQLGLNPIPDLTDTLEERGIKVFQTALGQRERFDGLAAQVDGSPLVVVGADWPGDRQRFTMAHELGHLVLAGRLSDGLDTERAVNRFAGAFLAPADRVRRALGHGRNWLEPRELALLKQEFGLSMGGWLHRAQDLQIITDATYRKLRRLFADRGWDRQEPFGDLPGEMPRLFPQLVYRALGQDLISESKAAELLGKSLMTFHAEAGDR